MHFSYATIKKIAEISSFLSHHLTHRVIRRNARMSTPQFIMWNLLGECHALINTSICLYLVCCLLNLCACISPSAQVCGTPSCTSLASILPSILGTLHMRMGRYDL